MVGLDDRKGLSQPKRLYVSMILWVSSHLCQHAVTQHSTELRKPSKQLRDTSVIYLNFYYISQVIKILSLVCKYTVFQSVTAPHDVHYRLVSGVRLG